MLPLDVNTYACPVAFENSKAPTTAVLPSAVSATEYPKASPALTPTKACPCDHVLPEPVNTYAPPVPPSFPFAPRRAVPPLSAIAQPKQSFAAPSEDVNSVASAHVDPGRVKT